jgi:hypothetical protein
VRDVRLNPMLPTAARFGGMPSDRFWAFEDGKVNLAQVTAGPTDIGRLLMLEFALAFSNDWFVIPVELPVGSLFRIRQFTVTDTFGVTSPVERAGDAAGTPWRMFELDRADGARSDAFLLAPAIDARLEGDPIEEVTLFRDEMANMAWAVERKVPGVMGLPVDRYQEATKRSASQRFAVLSNVTAELVYRVSTSVPEHWLPLVPVPKDDRPLAEFGIELERRAMLRHLDDGTLEPIFRHPAPHRPVESTGRRTGAAARGRRSAARRRRSNAQGAIRALDRRRATALDRPRKNAGQGRRRQRTAS